MIKQIAIRDIEVIIYPELASASLCCDESDLYVFWQILRAIDKYRGGSGKFQRSSLVGLYKHYFNVSEVRAYARVKYGVGRYWQKFGKDKDGRRATCLFGIQALVDRLEPKCTRSEPYVFMAKTTFDFDTDEVGELEEQENERRKPASLDVKYLMIACVAARYVDHRPNSIASIAELTGQSIRTVQRALNSCVDITKYPQHLDLGRFSTYEEAIKKLPALMAKGDGFYKVVKSGSGYILVRQIPNSYVLGQPKRLPLRKRPEALRERDAINLGKIKPKKYYQKDSKKELDDKRVKNSGMTSTSDGIVGLWKGQQQAVPAQRKTAKSISEKWAEQRQNTTGIVVR